MSIFKNLFSGKKNVENQADVNAEKEEILLAEEKEIEDISKPSDEIINLQGDSDSSETDDFEEAPKQKQSLFDKIFTGLDKTRKNILENVENVLKSFKSIDEDLFDELEEALIMADIGVETSTKIISNVRERIKKERINDVEKVKFLVIDEITEILKAKDDYELKTPAVILVIGVNGVGKTTTVGKLSHNLLAEGKTVMLAAADTFRAAAIDQLEIWGVRNNVPLIKHQENSDPAAVVFDGIQSAKSKSIDVLICDTAGRLHNKKNLMDELKKINKVIERDYQEAHKEVFLVLDATTGQNALQQARLFNDVADITGIVLTKLDSTAKGGIIIAIKNELDIPVRYIGVGEKISDLEVFDPEVFSKALFGLE